MRLFIDGEWNSYKGDLISLAIVPESGGIFYECLHCENPDEWVKANVIPKLGKLPISFEEFQRKLEHYLLPFETVHIIADWPEDIAYFCNALITGPGTRIDTPPLTLEVLRIDSVSENPHCALHDAIAFKAAVLQNKTCIAGFSVGIIQS